MASEGVRALVGVVLLCLGRTTSTLAFDEPVAPRELQRMTTEEPYRLFYWPSIQGRGEFVRLALEDAGAPYVDVARLPEGKGGGVKAMLKILKTGGPDLEPFAPPFLEHGDLFIAHKANVLGYLAPRIGLVPKDERSRLHAMQLSLSVTDLCAEVHDTHHPVASGLYYEDQKAEALRRATSFVRERIPKYLGYFERVLERAGGEHILGSAASYVDFEMFQIIEGLRYAFPRAMTHAAAQIPRLTALHDRVAQRPRLAAYLSSSRRIAFNTDGIFRAYPELDVDPS